MPYTAPTTRTTSDLITASIWNTDLVDNISFLANRPTVQVFMSAAQSVADATVATLLYNQETFDTDTMHSTVTNTNRITFTTAGVYLVGVQANFATDTDYDVVALAIRNSAGTTIAQTNDTGADVAGALDLQLTRLQKMNAGDWLDSWAYQDNVSGNAALVNAVFWACWQALG